MKLNFLNVLKKKSTPDEIAEQIVALEIKKTQCEKARDEAKNACKELRGKAMCDEKINPDDIRAADKAYDEAVLNLEIVTESIEEMHKALDTALLAHRDDESIRLSEKRKKLNDETVNSMKDLARAKGRIVGVAMALFGQDYYAIEHLGQSSNYRYDPDHVDYAEFKDGQDRALAELRHPTLFDVKEECSTIERQLAMFNLDDERKRILKKFQDKFGVVIAPKVN
jgi:hypothetical protein